MYSKLSHQIFVISLFLLSMTTHSEVVEINTHAIDVSGVVEVEAFVTDSNEYGNNSASDIVLATVELGIGTQINYVTRADISVLYEEDDTPIEVDTALLTFAADDVGMSLTLGQMYLPFGKFETAMVSDTLILELAETRETSALLSYNVFGMSFSGFVFRGDADDSAVSDYGFAVDYLSDPVEIGMSYINNLLDSDTFTGYIEEEHDGFDLAEGGIGYKHELSAATMNAMFNIGNISIMLEHIVSESVDNDLATALNVNADESVSASQLELSFSTTISQKEVVFATAYQKTKEALFLGLPEKRLSLAGGVNVLDNFVLGVELWRDYDYEKQEGGSGESALNMLMQIAVEF